MSHMIKCMTLDFGENKIEKIEEFALSLKEFNKLEYLELHLNNNLLKKLHLFSFNNNN
jgi:hypothetical protein